jgi:hypothetical protein
LVRSGDPPDEPRTLRGGNRPAGKKKAHSEGLERPLGESMANLNPLKYCFHGQHSRPRASFRTLPGIRHKREVCAQCYEKIMAERTKKKK